MKLLSIIIFIFIPITVFSQVKYRDYEIIFDAQNPLLPNVTTDSSQFYTEEDKYFDYVLQDKNVYNFYSSKVTGMMYDYAYKGLVELLGPEEYNFDYIPEEFINSLTDELLMKLCRTKQARISRWWKSNPDFDAYMLVTSKDITVGFSKKGYVDWK